MNKNQCKNYKNHKNDSFHGHHMMGLGNNLNELKLRIDKIYAEIDCLGGPVSIMEEMIDTTNLLRQNEYLQQSIDKKTQLIAAYDVYAKELEMMVSSLFSIQSELKDLIKTEAKLMDSQKRKKPIKKKKRI